MKKKKTTKGTKRTIFIYLLTLVLLYVAIYVVPQVSDIFVETYTAEYGTLQVTDEATCLFVRNEKTYTAESYDLMLGTVEEFMQIIDIDKVNDNLEVAKMVVKCYGQIRPLLKDVFIGVTDDELNQVKVKELIPVIIEICTTIIEDLDLVKSGN